MKNFLEKYGKISRCGLVFVLHLMKHDKNAKYLYEFRKLNKNRTTCILFYFYGDLRNETRNVSHSLFIVMLIFSDVLKSLNIVLSFQCCWKKCEKLAYLIAVIPLNSNIVKYRYDDHNHMLCSNVCTVFLHYVFSFCYYSLESPVINSVILFANTIWCWQTLN